MLQTKLPHKKMLIVTGVMIAVVLVTMVGHTVHVLQAVGWAPISPITDMEIPYWAGLWFGVYASWQSLIAQVAAESSSSAATTWPSTPRSAAGAGRWLAARNSFPRSSQSYIFSARVHRFP